MNIQDWFPLGSVYSLLQFIPQHKQDFFHSKIILNSIWKGSGPKRTKTIMPKKEWRCGRKYSVSAAAAKSLQLCPTLCDPTDGSPPGSPVPGILQARTLEWVAISFSNAWKWKVKVEVAQSCPTLHGLQPTRLLRPWDFPGKSTGVGCHRLIHFKSL